MITAREKICEILAEAGVDFVFGIPGGSAMRIFDSPSKYQERVRYESLKSITSGGTVG